MRPPTRMIPPKDNLLQFTDFNKMERVPFVVYADTEALLIKPEQELFKTMSTNSTLEDNDDRVKNYYKVLGMSILGNFLNSYLIPLLEDFAPAPSPTDVYEIDNEDHITEDDDEDDNQEEDHDKDINLPWLKLTPKVQWKSSMEKKLQELEKQDKIINKHLMIRY